MGLDERYGCNSTVPKSVCVCVWVFCSFFFLLFAVTALERYFRPSTPHILSFGRLLFYYVSCYAFVQSTIWKNSIKRPNQRLQRRGQRSAESVFHRPALKTDSGRCFSEVWPYTHPFLLMQVNGAHHGSMLACCTCFAVGASQRPWTQWGRVAGFRNPKQKTFVITLLEADFAFGGRISTGNPWPDDFFLFLWCVAAHLPACRLTFAALDNVGKRIKDYKWVIFWSNFSF